MAVDTLTPLLHTFLTCAENSLTEPVGRSFVAPGLEVAFDDCCDGQLWVRVVSIVPSPSPGASYGSRSVQGGACGVLLWEVQLAVGTVRCAATVDDQGNAPPAQNLTLDAELMLQDRADLEEAIRCCMSEQATRLQIIRWDPLGPQGGCVGGEWQFTTILELCACP